MFAMALMVQVPSRAILRGLAVPRYCPLLLRHMGWAGPSQLHEGILSQLPRLSFELLV